MKYLLQQNPPAHTRTCIQNGKPTHILEHSIYHGTLHTPFTILLWARPDEDDINKVLSIVNKFNDGARKFSLQRMLSNFEKFVKENRRFLPQELQDQVYEYLNVRPDNDSGLGIIGQHARYNF